MCVTGIPHFTQLSFALKVRRLCTLTNRNLALTGIKLEERPEELLKGVGNAEKKIITWSKVTTVEISHVCVPRDFPVCHPL